MNTSSWSQVAGHPRVRALVALVVAALTAAALVAAPTPAEAASNYDNVTQVLVDNFVDAAVEVSATSSTSTLAPGSCDARRVTPDAGFLGPSASDARRGAAAARGRERRTEYRPTAHLAVGRTAVLTAEASDILFGAFNVMRRSRPAGNVEAFGQRVPTL